MSPTLFIKRFLPRTLFGRSLLIIVSPLILLQVISTHIFYDRHWDTITRRLSSSIASDVSMVLNMIVAGLFGILVPVTLKRLKIDPAIASSVFVTTITDVIGFLSFLGIGAVFFLN